MNRLLLAGCVVAGGLLMGCGGTKKVTVKTRAVSAGPVLGPKASQEEIDGKVPPLKGIRAAKQLVPDKFVPPEAPSDPSFGPDGDDPAADAE
jgi:hypothetical protein